MNALSGMMGADFISTGGVHTPTPAEFYLAVQIITDTVFTALTASPVWGGDAISGTFPAGITIFGHFTSLQLTSGAVIAYKGN
jgi:hypothetical protein